MLPKFIKAFLWSNDLSKINLKKDKQRIILNILNLGTKGDLSDKSLNYRTLILNIDKRKIIGSLF